MLTQKAQPNMHAEMSNNFIVLLTPSNAATKLQQSTISFLSAMASHTSLAPGMKGGDADMTRGAPLGPIRPGRVVEDRAGKRKRRERQPNWETAATFALIEAKRAEHDERSAPNYGERGGGDSANKWAKVAERVWNDGASVVFRNAESCKDKWGQLHGEYKKIRHYQNSRAGTPFLSYWHLRATEKQQFHLPKTFHSRRMYDLMAEFLNPNPPRPHGAVTLNSSPHERQKHVGEIEEAAAIRDHLARLRETEAVGRRDGAMGLEGKQYECIQAAVVGDGTVGLVTLNRPKALNALSHALMLELVDALQTLDASTQVGAIVVTGKGEAFSAGVDIKEMRDKTNFVDAYASRFAHRWNAVTGIRKPIIAAMNGYAVGGGCELAMMCDIILAGERAQFGLPEINLGTIPGMGGSQRLIREVGKSRAMEMILTGKHFMNAHEAAQRGLVARVVSGDDERLVAEAVSLAREISQKSKPVVALTKEIVNTAYEMGLTEGVKKEQLLFHATFGLEDRREGMTAFLEKRSPVFQDK